MVTNTSLYVEMTLDELAVIEGGGVLSGLSDFVQGSWNVLYHSGRDFGRSVVNAVMR